MTREIRAERKTAWAAADSNYSATLSLGADRYSLSTRDVVQAVAVNGRVSSQADLSLRRALDWEYRGAGIINGS